jgi:hypothetical protein
MIGGVLTAIGLKMAWSQYRRANPSRAERQLRMRAVLAEHW